MTGVLKRLGWFELCIQSKAGARTVTNVMASAEYRAWADVVKRDDGSITYAVVIDAIACPSVLNGILCKRSPQNEDGTVNIMQVHATARNVKDAQLAADVLLEAGHFVSVEGGRIVIMTKADQDGFRGEVWIH